MKGSNFERNSHSRFSEINFFSVWQWFLHSYCDRKTRDPLIWERMCDQPDSTWSNFGETHSRFVCPISNLWCQGEKVLGGKKRSLKISQLDCVVYRLQIESFTSFPVSDATQHAAYLRLSLPSLFYETFLLIALISRFEDSVFKTHRCR